MYSHLHESRRALADRDNEHRLREVQRSAWINYPAASKALDKLTRRFNYSRTLRMHNLLIVGESNNGKTWILDRFRRLNPPIEEGEHKSLLPVVIFEPPSEPNESRFFDHLLAALHTPFLCTDRVSKKRQDALRLLDYAGTRMLMIDEIHKMLAGSATRQRQLHGVIRELGNVLRIPIVAAGTKEALRFVSADAQLSNRFDPVVLPRWQYDGLFAQLLASFEWTLPLRKASMLTSKENCSLIFDMSEGLLGEVHRILCRAAETAMDNGEERITPEILHALDWLRPSERRTAARELI